MCISCRLNQRDPAGEGALLAKLVQFGERFRPTDLSDERRRAGLANQITEVLQQRAGGVLFPQRLPLTASALARKHRELRICRDFCKGTL